MQKAAELLHSWAENAMRQSMWAFFKFNQTRSLSSSQVNSLFYINRSGKATVNDLAKRWGVSKAAASQIVEKMVDQGWLERTENPLDRRSRDLSLTAEGKALVKEAHIERHSWIDEFIKGLDDTDLEKVIPALEILNSKMMIFNEEFEKALTGRSHSCVD
ncbi:MAG: MarR family transcriptional regulator [Anaerolineaceae bacterium]|nr:MarR family transcriptional regulator [Anaerolineaceae bacterium]